MLTSCLENCGGGFLSTPLIRQMASQYNTITKKLAQTDKQNTEESMEPTLWRTTYTIININVSGATCVLSAFSYTTPTKYVLTTSRLK